MATLFTRYQYVNMCLEAEWSPCVVPVRMHDHWTRRIICTLYSDNVPYEIDTDSVNVKCEGTLPDGDTFSYESSESSVISVNSSGKISMAIIKSMTEKAGLIPVKISLSNGTSNIGIFNLYVLVKQNAIANGTGVYNYDDFVSSIDSGIISVFVTDDGYFGIESEFGLGDAGLSSNSDSDILNAFYDNILTAAINDDGYITFTTDDNLGLTFSTTDDGYLVVKY